MSTVRRISLLVLVLPIIVATIQFTLFLTSDLTLWKGGGFGMYSKPHPNSFRHIWLVGKNGDQSSYFRIYPKDERINMNKIKNKIIRNNLEYIYKDAKRHKNFPSLWSKEKLYSSVHNIVNELEKDDMTFEIFPRDSIQMIVTEMIITDQMDSLKLDHVFSESISNE